MLPALALQTKRVFPVEVAVNCCWAPEGIVSVAGDRLILFEDDGGCAAAEFEIPAQPVENQANAERRRMNPNCFGRLKDAVARS